MIKAIKYSVVGLCLLLSCAISTKEVNALDIFEEPSVDEYSSTTTLNSSEIKKLAGAINISKDGASVHLGEGYDVFDVNKDEFKNLFSVTAQAESPAKSISGSKSSEISRLYSSEFGITSGANIDIPVPVTLTMDMQSSFNKSKSSNLSVLNDEYYEYWQVTKTVKLAQVDWEYANVDNLFSENFKKDLSKVNDLVSAIELLEKYGTHVFDNYYFGGVLFVSSYVCSEKNISEEYASAGKNLSLSLNIASAIQANSGGSVADITANNLNTETTQSSSHMNGYGGASLNAITAEQLFTWREPTAIHPGGFVYDVWLQSIDNCERLCVSKVANSTPIWDILKNSALYDATTYILLKDAFESICYKQYGEASLELNENPKYINDLSYKSKNIEINYEIMTDEIILPENTNVEFSMGELITKQDSNKIKFQISSGNEFATLNQNILQINQGTNGKTIELELLLNDYQIYTLLIKVDKGYFENGFGTKEQPYFISSAAEWNQLINNPKYYQYHYKIINDIDLAFKHYSTGGSSSKKAFTGSIDGNNHKISNATIIHNDDYNNVGMFGINEGNITNLIIENVKVLNTLYLTKGTQLNAGILVGYNKGNISNIHMNNCTIRVAGTMRENDCINVGVISGYSEGKISLTSVNQCYVMGISYNGEGTANVGCLVGKANYASIENVISSNNKTSVYNYQSSFLGEEGSKYIEIISTVEPSARLYIYKDGQWVEENVEVKAGKPEKNKNDGKYFFNISENKLYVSQDKKWVLIENVFVGQTTPFSKYEKSAIYNLGAVIGKIENKSNVEFVISYKNEINQKTNNYGYIAGNVINSNLANCCFESTNDAAVAGKKADGCEVYRKLTLDSIANAEWNTYWKSNDDGYPILK